MSSSAAQGPSFPAWAWIGVAAAMLGASACGGGSDKESGGTTSTDPVVGTREDPVPVGEIADIGADWQLQVLDVIPDGSALIAANDPDFEPAPAGFTYLLVRLALGYFGTQDPQLGSHPEIEVVDASDVALDDFCSVAVPDADQFGYYLFSGGVVVGNVCFLAPVAEAGTFQLYGNRFDGREGGAYFELGSPSAAVQPMASLTGPQPGAQSTPGRLDPAPLGTPIAVGENWQITVTGAARDVTDEVLAADDSIGSPPSGYHFEGVELTFVYNGDFPAAAELVSLGSVDSSNVSNELYCSVGPGEIDRSTELVAGESTSGTYCLAVRDDASDSLLFASLFGFEPPLTWFAMS